jgi:hypothetical protein
MESLMTHITLAAVCYLASGCLFAFLSTTPYRLRMWHTVLWALFWPVVILLAAVDRSRR